MKHYIRLIVTILAVVSLTGCFGNSRKDPAKMATRVAQCYQTGNYEKIATYLTETDKQKIVAVTGIGDFLGGLLGGKKKEEKSNPKEGEDKTVSTVVSIHVKYKQSKEGVYGALSELKVLPGEYSADKTTYKAKTQAVFAKKTIDGDMSFTKGQDRKWYYSVFQSNPLGK